MGAGSLIECKTEIINGIAATNQQRGSGAKGGCKGIGVLRFHALTISHKAFEVL